MVERKTITVREQTHQRLEELKPYDTVSFDELLNEMADQYESGSNG